MLAQILDGQCIQLYFLSRRPKLLGFIEFREANVGREKKKVYEALAKYSKMKGAQ